MTSDECRQEEEAVIARSHKATKDCLAAALGAVNGSDKAHKFEVAREELREARREEDRIIEEILDGKRQ